MKKVVLFFIVPFCSLFILVGALIAGASLRKIIHGVAARNWPTTMGTVTQVGSKDTSDSESSSREITVRYSYTVAGRTLEGKTIHPAYGSSSFEKAHAGLEHALQEGKNVQVHYHPEDPTRCTLSVGFYSCSLAAVFFGLLFMGAGIGFLGAFWFALAGSMNFADGISVGP